MKGDQFSVSECLDHGNFDVSILIPEFNPPSTLSETRSGRGGNRIKLTFPCIY